MHEYVLHCSGVATSILLYCVFFRMDATFYHMWGFFLAPEESDTHRVRQRQCTDNGYRLRRIGKLLKSLPPKIVAYLQFSNGALFAYRRIDGRTPKKCKLALP